MPKDDNERVERERVERESEREREEKERKKERKKERRERERSHTINRACDDQRAMELNTRYTITCFIQHLKNGRRKGAWWSDGEQNDKYKAS